MGETKYLQTMAIFLSLFGDALIPIQCYNHLPKMVYWIGLGLGIFGAFSYFCQLVQEENEMKVELT